MPTTSLVTPCRRVLAQSRLASRLQSEWEWQSIKPGATTIPLASTTVAAEAPERSPRASMRWPMIPTSARTQGAPLPSTTRPPRMTTSNISLLLALPVPAAHGW